MRLRSSTPAAAAALSLALASCGARSALLASGLSGEVPDAGSTTGPDGGAPPAPVCHTWAPTSAPVQVSTTPSIVIVLSATPVPGGVLVGYADAQLPPVDPAWHLRTVSYGGASLGPEQSVFVRDTSQLGWSGIFTATSGGAMLATASDQADGMYTVTIDATGAPTGTQVTTSGNQGQFLAAAGGGFTVLRSPWDDTGEIPPPVSLATLSATGDVLAETTILAASPSIVDFGRVVRDDASFLLWWYETTAAGGRYMGQPFDATGDAQGSPVLLHALGAMDDGGLVLATSTSTTLGVWPASTTSGATLMAQRYDAAGAGIGGPVAWGTDEDCQGVPTMAATGAPGGDYAVAWIDQSETGGGNLEVQAVASDGTAEGLPTLLGGIAASPETYLFVVATAEGAMVLYESDTPEYVEVFAIPLQCVD